MKLSFILKLIETHCSKSEESFAIAVEELAKDEEIKGKVALANSIRKTYKDMKSATLLENASKNSFLHASNTNLNIIPKDKDSSLELFNIQKSDIKLDDVTLNDAQSSIIRQIIEEQKHRDKLELNNIYPTNRIILCGPPGCGKTTVANAIAGQLGLDIVYVRLDAVISSYLGQTSNNLRKIFDFVSNKSIMLFLDEFDAIAKKRDDDNELGELKRVVTALLQNFDGLSSNVLLVAATNHEHLLDPAIWRRFNKSIYIDLPDFNQRKILFSKWLDEVLVDSNLLDLNMIAQITEGVNGANIKELVHTTVKRCLINNIELTTNEFIMSFVDFITNYQRDDIIDVKVLKRLHDNGISIRSLSSIFNIPKSTVNYKLKGDKV